ncbi:MAG: sensory rhodopsin transducer [Anaerolineales bacterium]
MIFFHQQLPLANPSTGSHLQIHYLPDFEYSVDETNGFGRIPHLSIFNPGANEATLTITIFYEEGEPTSFQQVIPARSSFETDASHWDVPLNSRFGMKVESTEPVITQATEGWNNTKNDYSLNGAPVHSDVPRETAKSYMSHNSLAKECYIADGIIIDIPEALWIKETEDMAVLNPNKEDMTVTINAYYGHRGVTRFQIPLDIPVMKKQVKIPAERVGFISLTEWIKPNWHYGARVTADQPFAAQWLRMVYWYDSAELMSEWSAPCVQMQ